MWIPGIINLLMFIIGVRNLLTTKDISRFMERAAPYWAMHGGVGFSFIFVWYITK